MITAGTPTPIWGPCWTVFLAHGGAGRLRGQGAGPQTAADGHTFYKLFTSKTSNGSSRTFDSGYMEGQATSLGERQARKRQQVGIR